MTEQYNLLKTKLNKFIHKFYKNKILKGIIISSSLYLFLFLLITIVEYFAYFNITTKTIIFYSFIILSIFIFIEFIAIPFLKFIRIGKIISFQNASNIISAHFSEIKDKLLNILELADKPSKTGNYQLILASIDQKINQINYFSFNEVIQYRKNIKYLKYFFIPFIIFLYLLLFQSKVLTQGTERFINHRIYYEPEMPFNYYLLNDSLTIKKGEDFKIHLKIKR